MPDPVEMIVYALPASPEKKKSLNLSKLSTNFDDKALIIINNLFSC